MVHSGTIPLLFTQPLRRRTVLAAVLVQQYLTAL